MKLSQIVLLRFARVIRSRAEWSVKEPGVLRVVAYGPMRIDSDGVLLKLKFTAVAPPGSESDLMFERIMFNEGDPNVIITDGQVDISNAVSNSPAQDDK